MPLAKITEAYLKQCSLPQTGQVLVYDTELKGFGIRLNSKSIVFFIEKRLGGTIKKQRVTIGPYPIYKVAEARREAEVRIAELIKGIDRKALERSKHHSALPLGKLLTEYLSQRKLKHKTAARYKSCFERLLPDWVSKPWTEITASMVKLRHAQISMTNGEGTANYTFRALSAVMNYAMGMYRDEQDQPLLRENPVLVLSRTKSWNKLKPRTNYIKESELVKWWNGIEKLNNQDAKDFFRLLLLTGLRRSEALSMRWTDINFSAKSLSIPSTKNGHVHELPLSPYLIDLLWSRKLACEYKFVFGGNGKTGHLVEIKRSLRQANKLTGIHFSCHDLRRSFAMYADILEINSNGLKRLLNHRSGQDVTLTHYLPFNVERLRKPMDKINRYILSNAGVIKPSIVPMNEAAEMAVNS